MDYIPFIANSLKAGIHKQIGTVSEQYNREITQCFRVHNRYLQL